MTFWRSCLTDAVGEQGYIEGAGWPLLVWPFYRRTPLRLTRYAATGGALAASRSTVEHPRSPA